jgi:hypothetical protein
MVPELIWALDFFGPQEIWSPINLGPKKLGPREVWAPRSLGPEKVDPCMKIII